MGGFLGTAGPLANLLGFGAPIANTAGGIIQNTQNVRQRNASEQSFINMVDQMGPEYAWAQNWLKQAGPRAVPDVAAALGGPKAVGEMFQRQAMLEQIAPILNDPTLSPDQVARQVYAKTGDPELLEKLWGSEFRVSSREPPLTPAQMVVAIKAGINKAPEGIRGYLQAAVDAAEKDPDGSRGLVSEAYRLLYPSLQASWAQQLVPQMIIGHDVSGNPIFGPVSFSKTGTGPGTPRGFTTPPGVTGGVGTGGTTSGVSAPTPGAAPSPGEEGGDEGAAAAPEASATPGGGVTGMAGRALSSALGAYGGALGGAGIGAPTAIPTPGETSIPTEEPTEEETPTPLPTRVPTTVPSETETPTPTPTPIQLAAGEPIPSPTLEAGGPSIPVSVSTPGIGAPPGPFTKGPKTILGMPSARPSPAVTYGVPKVAAKTLATGQQVLDTYQQGIGLLETMHTFTPEEWNRSVTNTLTAALRRYGDLQAYARAGISTGNQKVDDAISQLITFSSRANISLLATAGSHSTQMITYFHGHIPTGFDSYEKILSNMRVLMAEKGPYVGPIRQAGITPPQIPTYLWAPRTTRESIPPPTASYVDPKTGKRKTAIRVEVPD